LAGQGLFAPIVGISKLVQLEGAVEALQIQLSGQEIAYLELLYLPRTLTGHYAGRAMPGDFQK
jgi:1-deoxyxylulose-5-phosphate synthase